MGTFRNSILTALSVIFVEQILSSAQPTSLLTKPTTTLGQQPSSRLLDILTSSRPLQVHIKGPNPRTTSTADEDEIFEAGVVQDPDSPTADIFFSWTSMSYSNAGKPIGSCIKPGSPTTDQQLTINPSWLKNNTTCTITLTVTSSTGKSGSGTIRLVIQPKTPPKCELENKRPVVKPGDRVTLTVTCTSLHAVKDTVWKSLVTEGLPALDLSTATEDKYTDALAYGVSKSVIVLKKGVLKAGGKYNLQSTVIDVNRAQTKNNATITVMQEISGGKLACPSSYAELESMAFTVTMMNNQTPMTYSLFVQTAPGTYRALSQKQDHGKFSTFGPHAYGLYHNIFLAEVCAEGQTDLCTRTSCTVSTVSASNVNRVVSKLQNQVDNLRQQGRQLEAAVLLGTLYEKTKDRNLISQILNIARETVDKKSMNDNSASTVLDVLVNIPPEQLSQEQVTSLTTTMSSATDFFIDNNKKVPERFVSALDLWVVRAEAAGLSDVAVRAVAEKAVMAESSGLEQGNSHTHYLESSRVTTFNDIPGNSVHCRDGSDNDIHINFGPSVRDKVGHQNVKFKVRAYKNPPKHILQTKTSAIAPVVDMSFLNPSTHTEEHVTDLEKPATLYLTLNKEHADSHIPALCVYWCPRKQAWVTEGVETGIQTSTTVECRTSHFSTYTVVHAYEFYNRDHNVGWIVGTVLAVIIAMILIIILIVYLVYKVKPRRVTDSPRSQSRLANSQSEERKGDDRRNDGGNNRRSEDETDELTQNASPNNITSIYDHRPGSGDGEKRGIN